MIMVLRRVILRLSSGIGWLPSRVMLVDKINLAICTMKVVVSPRVQNPLV